MVSGTITATHINCNTIMNAKMANTIPAPILVKRTGTIDGIIAANTQCVEDPKACPEALKCVGNISEIKTHITAPWPIACAAINMNKKMGTAIPPQFKKNAIATNERERIYPIEPIYNNCFLPLRSINAMPMSVKIKLVNPIPILLNRAELDSNPASSKILGA